ncbi:MAG: hypothetical protein J6P72_01590 [Firmicutes bacterium]|nr:hypothetical protein [Bacillota bacterium]
MKLFNEQGRFLRGNLHTHTTISDGEVSPEESIRRYREEGYDFLAITDHRKRFGGLIEKKDGTCEMAGTALEDVLAEGTVINEALNGTDDYRFLVIPSTEFDRNFMAKGPEHAYHITGVGLRSFVPQTNDWTPQEIVDAIHKADGFATLAHPNWSLMTVEECLQLERYDAIEIFNSVSEAYSGRGVSDLYVDMMASRGRYPLITAVDDTHFYDRDPFGGWVMVQAEKNNWPSIHQALLDGKFYSTQGPKIFQIETERHDGTLTVSVKTSEVCYIRFMTNALYNSKRTAYPEEEGKTITSASYTLSDMDRFVRIEGRDADGKFFWSNIIVK